MGVLDEVPEDWTCITAAELAARLNVNKNLLSMSNFYAHIQNEK